MMTTKKHPVNWSPEIQYLSDNVYSRGTLKQKNFKSTDTHPSHPFSCSPLTPVALAPALPSSLVKIVKLKNQKGHPAYPGSGLFAKQDLKERELILCYTGKVTKRGDEDEESNYVLGFGKEL